MAAEMRRYFTGDARERRRSAAVYRKDCRNMWAGMGAVKLEMYTTGVAYMELYAIAISIN
jgi:hypothetical protein